MSDQELVDRVVEVTGANETESRHFLSACANDVEAAVALFFEQGGSATAPIPVDDDDEDVRAPIAPIREQLIGPDDHDNFFTGPPPPARLLRVSQRVKVCPLRDFEREGALLEEQLHAAAAASGSITDNFATSSNSNSRMRRRARAAAMVTAAQDSSTTASSSSRLGDLFRPPTDIVYAGRFQAARMHATELKQWLLVNVQSDNFDSQLLNRDVWSDKEVRRLIGEQFLLWQVDSDSSEGRRFCAFYHCGKLPYVCVIDPRTGEEIWKSAEPKQSTLLQELQQFLRQHKDFSQELEEDAPSTSKRAAECHNLVGDEAATSANPKKRSKIMELSEAEQIALAIRNSMSENGAAATSNGKVADDDEDNDDGDCDSIEEFVDDDTKAPSERTSYETQLGSAKDELTMIKLRLLNSGGADEVVQLRWPSDTQVQVLRCYITQQQPHVHGYKLICAYPRKTLEAKHDRCTLKEMGLHPSANLHVTLED